MFVFFFRLQAVGGPVYLSQIGYVGAAVGLICRHAVPRRALRGADLDRRGIIAVGVVMTTKAQGHEG